MIGFSFEKRPLKRPRLGPPDVYPQSEKQREDKLDELNVKQGFSHIPQIPDEFGTSKNCNINSTKLGAFINGTISKKLEINILPDTGKRRNQVNTKDHFWPVTPRLKHMVEAWMKDLAGNKSLSVLGKKVPIFNKREEIFLTLADSNVPMLRAAWFLKMTASYNSAISEAKTKKRQMPDPSQEWTVSLQRCLKDILMRLSDWYNGTNLCASNNPNPNGGGSTPNQNIPTNTTQSSSSTTVEDGTVYLRQWQYCIDLARHLYEEGLLDRFEWLQWVIDACERARTIEDGLWKALVPLLLSYITDISQSELLARRLAYLACRRVSSLFVDFEFPQGDNNNNGQPVIQPPQLLLDHLQCPAHRTTLLALVSTIQVITLECPSAMIYNANGIGSVGLSNGNLNGASPSENNQSVRTNNIVIGSPLDLIPIPPSALPMPPRSNNPVVRLQLKSAEEGIMKRSLAVEAKWACEEWQNSTAATTLQKILNALDSLDQHCFDKVEQSNSLEFLYSKIFPNPPVKENPVENDLPIVLLLCQWAVGSQRTGEHRSLAVARILEHRQADSTSNQNDKENQSLEMKNENLSGDDGTGNGSEESGENGLVNMNGDNSNSCNGNSNSNGNDDDEGPSSSGGGYYGLPIYHNLLFKFLDGDAPILDESSSSPQNKATFSSLVHLFSALIRHDIFSHDAYLCSLVARGDLSMSMTMTGQTGNNNNNNSNQNVQQTQVQSVATPGQAPVTPTSVASSVAAGTTPHHDGEDRGPLFAPLPTMRMNEGPRQLDYDDRNIDDDLDKILSDITQGQNNMDQIDSPKDDSGEFHNNSSSNSTNEKSGNGPSSPVNSEISRQCRHRLYVTHFPIPIEESYQNEINQRQILLYGVGRSRDEARHTVKKVSKELSKLFSKKFCYDISDGSRVKKHSRNEINMEALQNKFSALTYFDQNSVTSTAGSAVIEMLSSFASGRGNYLPSVENIAFLTELMEVAFNVNGLLELTIQILRELTDIEIQLCQRGSSIAGHYSTSFLLQIVAILRRYHCSLLLDTEMTMLAWEGLIRLMRRFTSSSECTSAERCAFAYLTELQSCCFFLRTKTYLDELTPIAAKLRQNLNSNQGEGGIVCWNNTFMTQCLDNPRRKDPNSIRQLIESPSCRYSFVCNAILSICNEADMERLNDLASLCADMTASSPALATEWLSVLQSLCSPSRDSRHQSSYGDDLSEIDVKHLTIHSSLATLTAMLVARQCFSLQDFVVQAVPSLLKAWNEGRGPQDPNTEAGARLTCHLLSSLFKTQDALYTASSVLKLSCDRRLLSATHNSISLGPVLAVLKAMLLMSDAALNGSGERRREQSTISGLSQRELSISHILGTSDVHVPSERSENIRGERTLASFALNALQQMCSEPWVRTRCLQNPEELCNSERLLDPLISNKQAQRLLHLICYPELQLPDENLDARSLIPRIMEGLDQWNLREAWLGLTLQSKQLAGNNPLEYQNWLDIVARSALEVFNLEDGPEFITNSATPSPGPARLGQGAITGKSPRSGKKQDKGGGSVGPAINSSSGKGGSSILNKNSASVTNLPGTGGAGEKSEKEKEKSSKSAWLIAPLISRLSSQVQGRVLRHAGNVLESTLWPRNPQSIRGNCSLQSHLPFLALILTCLCQDEQREGLLASLLNQFTQLLALSKDVDSEDKGEALRNALRLRLSLVGGMFDSIQRSTSTTTEWALVLTQLVTHRVVDINSNSDVYPTVIDMVASLVHSTQITETGERIEEMRKQNLNLIKKLKKELIDDTLSVKPLRQLLPFSKVQSEIIVTQPTSTITDHKGNRVQSFEFVDKKPGLQVWEKQRVSPWELLEGQKNTAPLSWSWFGAVKMERKALRYEEAHRLLRYHTHSLIKPTSHFFEPVPLPLEEVDVKPEIVIKEEPSFKPDTPSSESPRGPPSAPQAKKKANRRRRQTKTQQQQSPVTQIPLINSPASHGSQISSNVGSPFASVRTGPSPIQSGPPPPVPTQSNNFAPEPPPQWYNPPPNAPPPNSTYYPPPSHQPPPPLPPHASNAPRPNTKLALHSMLRARHPSNQSPQNPQFAQQQFPPGGGGGGTRHHILRNQLRGPANPAQIANTGFQGGIPQQGISQQVIPQQGQQQQQHYQMQQQMPQQQPTGQPGQFQQMQQPGLNQNYNYTQNQQMGGQLPSQVQQPSPNVNISGMMSQSQSIIPMGGQPRPNEMNSFMSQGGQQRPMAPRQGFPGNYINRGQVPGQGQVGQGGQMMGQMGGQINNSQRLRHIMALQQQTQQQNQQHRYPPGYN